MERSIIILLVGAVGLAVLTCYLLYIRRVSSFRSHVAATFVSCTFVAIPLFVVVLARQHLATDRLAETGIVPHPSIEESVGVATGSDNPDASFWAFRVGAPPEEIMDFYRAQRNRRGWIVVGDGKDGLVLEKGERRMSIAVHEDQRAKKLFFHMTRKRK
ncbi:MAG: hypothetical protein JXP73_22420 [Deltaproteobacteria bacterium]|nr:hypothetical protein [Deltaproteobacteria bacterium]